MTVIVNGKKVEVNSTMKVRMNPSSKANSALQKKKRVYYVIGDNGNKSYKEKGWSDIPYDKALALEKYNEDWGENFDEAWNWFCESGIYGEGFPKDAPWDWFFIKSPTIYEIA